MSRAFVKEDDTKAAEIERPAVGPHRITPAGLARLQRRRDELAGVAGVEAENERQRLEALLLAADLVPALTVPPASACFGTRVIVTDEDDEDMAVTLVGEHEADPAAGRVSFQSPLGRALIGAAVGDMVTWRRPAGNRVLEIVALTLPDEA